MEERRIDLEFWSKISEYWTDSKSAKARRKKSTYVVTDDQVQRWLDNITLSPDQLAVVQQDEDTLLINGSAGSGKSIALVYRMMKAMHEEKLGSRVLYVSYNVTLIQDAQKRLSSSPKFWELKNAGHDPHIHTFHNMAKELLWQIGIKVPKFRASTKDVHHKMEVMRTHTGVFIDNFMESETHKSLPKEQQLYKTHRKSFFMDEILWMKANGFIYEEKYLEVERTGRGNNPRITKEQRKTIFRLYEEYNRVREEKYHGELDAEDYALLLLRYFDRIPESLKYDHIFIDEVQDLQPMQIMVLAKLCKKTLTLSGDPKQRIYKRNPLSYKELGVEVEGKRNRRLKINYRSTKQIMALAGSLQFLDTENDRESEKNFVREGLKPQIRYYSNVQKLNKWLVNEVHKIREADPGSTIAVIHRYDDDYFKIKNSPIRAALAREFDLITTDQYGHRFNLNSREKPLFFTDAYSVKGLEFDYVFILHFDRLHYPSQQRIEALDQLNKDRMSETYQKDEDEIINDEKKVLYVALTRAKKQVWLLYAGQSELSISQFVRDFDTRDYEASGFKKSMYGKKAGSK
ncbi:UvrD-helicase domain-containing protein [Tumebacillus sp. DT12]|uniref:DNA 3'-5' helicase n=1 Tax=Tumebacillus lacus TaxID=2995335 RepID=A0ABT3X4A3_9BACL|nr:UvrD-helicase domain-containing protein [Tumebacillus lacus]MCX7571730.1 UvrD-helicase domain-containing protein [Tumebacillus lacus]